MKKLLIILVSFILIVSVGGCHMRDSKSEQEQLIEFAKSEEVRKIIEDDLKVFESAALTERGKIKSYTLDEQSVKVNPMGGINFKVYINHQSDLYVFYSIDKAAQSDELFNRGGGNSAEFEKLIGEKDAADTN